MLYSILLSAVLLASGLVETGAAEATDTLSAVTVVADRGVVVSRKDTIPFINSESVPQMLRRSSGVHIGDYGGLSGLKNVSLRGLGSAHTAIYLDGVRVGNVQSGQNDLSMLGGVTLPTAQIILGRDPFAMAVGFAIAAEHPQLCLEELVNVADRMMYAEKDKFYQNMKMNGHRALGADLCE